MTESRWVLDTNTLISRLLVPAGIAGRAVDAALARGVLLVSDATLAELADVLARPKFDRYLSQGERQHFFRLLCGVARTVNITQRTQACRDPKDNQFLDVALCGEADATITGDADLLVLHPHHGVAILTPAQFLNVYSQDERA
jgi:putative PIN family toxin of toxin-antitoxin system